MKTAGFLQRDKNKLAKTDFSIFIKQIGFIKLELIACRNINSLRRFNPLIKDVNVGEQNNLVCLLVGECLTFEKDYLNLFVETFLHANVDFLASPMKLLNNDGFDINSRVTQALFYDAGIFNANPLASLLRGPINLNYYVLVGRKKYFSKILLNPDNGDLTFYDFWLRCIVSGFSLKICNNKFFRNKLDPNIFNSVKNYEGRFEKLIYDVFFRSQEILFLNSDLFLKYNHLLKLGLSRDQVIAWILMSSENISVRSLGVELAKLYISEDIDAFSSLQFTHFDIYHLQNCS